MIRLTSGAEVIFATEDWASREMKNHFNSSVLHEGFLDGFDNSILKCLVADIGEGALTDPGLCKRIPDLCRRASDRAGEEGLLATVKASSESH